MDVASTRREAEDAPPRVLPVGPRALPARPSGLDLAHQSRFSDRLLARSRRLGLCFLPPISVRTAGAGVVWPGSRGNNPFCPELLSRQSTVTRLPIYPYRGLSLRPSGTPTSAARTGCSPNGMSDRSLTQGHGGGPCTNVDRATEPGHPQAPAWPFSSSPACRWEPFWPSSPQGDLRPLSALR